MGKSKKIPLVSGLLGLESGSIYGQIEISLSDHDTVNIVIRRKAYSGLPDITFSLKDTDLKDFIGVLEEAKKKVDAYWISRLATASVKA